MFCEMEVSIGLVRNRSSYLHRSDGENPTSTFLKKESSFEHHWWKVAHVHLLHHVANSQLGDPATAKSMPAETTGTKYLSHWARYDNQDGDGDGNDDDEEEEDDDEEEDEGRV